MITIVLLMLVGAVASNEKCPANGWCVKKDGIDQNTGSVGLGSFSEEQCLAKCQAYNGATGCEWHIGRGCSVHTHEVDHGSGAADYFCWAFSKCLAQKLKCNVIADVGFILDSSGSLSGSYQLEKNFLKSVAAAFGISKDGPRASVVTFSLTAELSIKFNDYFDKTSFNDAVDAIPLMGRNTRIDRALRRAQTNMFRTENGARVNSPKILVLLTDGSQTEHVGEENLEVISNELRQHGVYIIVVGIGDGINHAELAQIAGSPDKVFTAASFEELVSKKFIKTLTDKSCKLASMKKDEEMD